MNKSLKNHTSKWWLEVNKTFSWMKMNAGKQMNAGMIINVEMKIIA